MNEKKERTKLEKRKGKSFFLKGRENKVLTKKVHACPNT